MKDSLERQLKAWDGIHMDHLATIYDQYLTHENFFNLLIQLTKTQPPIQDATTWIIKHHFDNGHSISAEHTDALLKTSLSFQSWPAKLHVLQIIPHLQINTDNFITIDSLSRDCLDDTNKFVRAWAYQALYQLYEFCPDNKEELIALCELAMTHESASIKVKVRKILTKLVQF